MTLTLRTTRSLLGVRSIISQAARYLPVAFPMLAVLSLTQSTVFAGTIKSFGPVTPSGCSSVPSPLPSPSTNAFAVNMSPLDLCVINYSWDPGPAANNYPLAFTITNNTGQVVTDLHVELSTSVTSGLPFFSGGAVDSGPLVLVGQTSSTLDFNWVSTKLQILGMEKFSVNLTLPQDSLGGSDLILILPTFGSAAASPEPTSLTLGLSGAVLVGLGAWRRRRPSRYQGQTIPPPC